VPEDTVIDDNVEVVEEKSVSDDDAADVISEARENLVQCMTAEGDYREKAVSDLNFRVGNQWPAKVMQDREQAGQPCLQFNLIPKFIRQVTGDARQNVPGINVVPENSKASKEVADVLKGVVRYIEHASVASYVYAKGLDSSAASGRGYWRVDTDYTDDDTFDQEIRIFPIVNSMSVYFDPLAVGPCYQNAEWCIVRQWQNKKGFERDNPGKNSYPDAIEGAIGSQSDWFKPDAVCIAEYWRKESVDDELLSVKIFPQDPDIQPYETTITKSDMLKKYPDVEITVLKRRKITRPNVVCYTITGNDVIHKRDWPGKFIPIVPVLGEETNVDGKDYLAGIIRDMKDPQQAYNYWMTMLTEQIALAPKVPWVVTDFMIEPYKQEWDNMNNRNYPYVRYRPDPANPGGPQRQQPAQMSQGYAQMMQFAQGALNDTSGIFKPALGQESNETSGRAILARQKEGDTGTYVYIANWLLSVQYTGQIIVDLIPKIYDTERVLMILDENEEMQQIPVNQQFESEDTPGQKVQKIYDVRLGKYGVKVTSGPSYTTRRQEGANSLMEFMRIYPDAAPVIGDKLAHSMDWDGADEIGDRLKALAIQKGFLAPDASTGQPPPQTPQGGTPPQGPGGPPVAGPAAQETNIDQMLATPGVANQPVI
jgi:hypothetical protein